MYSDFVCLVRTAHWCRDGFTPRFKWRQPETGIVNLLQNTNADKGRSAMGFCSRHAVSGRRSGRPAGMVFDGFWL